jgi:predicted nucleotide-binding protein (sugar kinase/HSP70/actin superfamily)
MIALTKERKKIMKEFPNLVDYESKQVFRHFYDSEAMPEASSVVEDLVVEKAWHGFGVKKTAVKRSFQRSSPKAWEERRKVRVGIPKVLNIWSLAPFFRTYLEALGIQKQNVVFSDNTSEEMWLEGGKYGSIDPCYPSKVAQAHIHNLLFRHHNEEGDLEKGRARVENGSEKPDPNAKKVAKKLNYIFFPCITHVPPGLNKVMDTASCPIVAGAPEVMKAAFTKETDFFATRGIKYLDPALTFTEPTMLKRQLFSAFGAALGVTEDESDFACAEGWKAHHLLDKDLQEKGRAILETVEEENRVAVLMIGRPYHTDPGLNHGILEEFQVLGYPILSMRSIPKDPAWLKRFFEADLASGKIEGPLEVQDVWPENYSANSVQKVWAAKFAARHPNVVVLDLSSFKCGHDAPTYGLVDSIISASATPYSALHDIDANKPGGSIKIRVKTYAHSLKLHEERLEDIAVKTDELKFKMEEKRLSLLQMKERQLADRKSSDPNLAQMIAEAKAKMEEYGRKLAARRQPVDPVAQAQEAGLVRVGIKRADGAMARV